jgi:transcriptional regulator with XRE-family HTH domain
VEDPEFLVRRVGRRIAELRQRAGLTQEELAEQLGVGWRYLSRAERGENLTLRTLAKIANVFGVEAKSLLNKPRNMSVKPGRPKKK